MKPCKADGFQSYVLRMLAAIDRNVGIKRDQKTLENLDYETLAVKPNDLNSLVMTEEMLHNSL